ncbi:aminotransferase class V-fold PLP-dependent enzyme [Chelativorans sp. M5D2P16]|uniref:aminotransferase class V-fold PLP-dependent enzyme n=1 Tax=Chelativorans sp. M5D2P16 TaxID=3095678 RepID=UPI002ACA89FF|nr:aminotransferase class V-fold PLP-dependent enzyme [Chelativorans sp. M5D2P16]MDZ5699749.1 aminotransferase class V-fold PLP-dependent enzyme [Chelativorans sp. M5D2P16]
MQGLEHFAESLRGDDLPARLRAGLIGESARIEGPFGPKPLIYADYVASGRALVQIEDFVREAVLPYYANSHTEASHCGAFCTRLREEARDVVRRAVRADEATSVVFAGSGATTGINKLVRLLQVPEMAAAGQRPVVFIGPYEHHSNILPWRESGAETVEIPEARDGGPDLDILAHELESRPSAVLKVGVFSAASNVTGIVTDTDKVTRLLKAHGALAVWDYAGGAPYLAMDMRAGTDCAKDAIVFSPHKFPGGPGASGVLVLRNAVARTQRPSMPGGGSVTFVSPWTHDYSASLSAREEAGTPNVVGDIRAALVLLVKEALGRDFIERRNHALRERALAVWSANPHIELLGNTRAPALPIFSFRVRRTDGTHLHHQLFTRMLSDAEGIQARGGCACAGPYAHRLLDIDEGRSRALLAAIRAGREIEKPGWVRLNLSYLLDDEKADRIIGAVDRLARGAETIANAYTFDPTTARFKHETTPRDLEERRVG